MFSFSSFFTNWRFFRWFHTIIHQGKRETQTHVEKTFLLRQSTELVARVKKINRGKKLSQQNTKFISLFFLQRGVNWQILTTQTEKKEKEVSFEFQLRTLVIWVISSCWNNICFWKLVVNIKRNEFLYVDVDRDIFLVNQKHLNSLKPSARLDLILYPEL